MPSPASSTTLDILVDRILGGQERLSAVCWETLLRTARNHGLLPLLWWRMRQTVAVGDQPLRDQLRECFEQNVRNNLALAADLVGLLRQLQSAGIRALAYKGPAFALTIHHQLGLRESTDIDLLISPADASRAASELLALGYKTSHELSERQMREFLRNECESDLVDGHGRMVDLHWNLVPRHYGVHVAFDPLWERRQCVSLGDAQVPTFSSSDTVLALAIHGTKHLWSRLCWLWDLTEAMKRPDVDWEELLARAKEAGAEGMLAVGVKLAQDILHVPIAPDTTALLRQNPVASRIAGEIRARLRSDHLGAPDAERWRTLLRLQKGWLSRAASVAGYLSTSGVEEWSAVRLPDALFPLYSLVRLARIVGGRKSRL